MIGIISDTHDNVANIRSAIEVFKKFNVEFVIHLGDIISPLSLLEFRELKMKFVKGNCDGDVEALKRKAEEIGASFYTEKMVLELNGKKFYCTHAPDMDAIESGEYDYVLHGHTHVKKDDRIGKTRVINPGAHYYGNENTVAILDIEKDKLEFVEL